MSVFAPAFAPAFRSPFRCPFGGSIKIFNTDYDIKPYYVENIIRNRPSYSSPAGIAKYASGAYSLICSGLADSTALTVIGGDTLADAGTGIWQCVVEYPDGSLEFNIVESINGSLMTLVYPLLADGPVNIWAGWQSNLDQHYSLKGVKCLAESVAKLDKKYATRNTEVFGLQYGDVFATNPWVKLSPQVWQPVGGLASNKINQGYSSILNPFTPEKKILAGSKMTMGFTSSALGHGAELQVPLLENFTGLIQFSTGIYSDGNYEGLAEIIVDGTTVYSKSFKSYVEQHEYIVNDASSIILKATRTTDDSVSVTYRVGAVHLITDIETGRLLTNGSKILLCGDSWMSDAHPTGIGFGARLQELLPLSTITNKAVGGMTTRWALKWLPYFLAQDSPDSCIINFFVNDNNDATGQTFIDPDGNTCDLNVVDHEEWGDNIRQLVAICVAAKCVPIVMLPSITASLSQSLAHMNMQVYAGQPTLTTEWLTEATASEIVDVAFVGNVRNKFAGRELLRVNDGVTVVATGSDPTDTWVEK